MHGKIYRALTKVVEKNHVHIRDIMLKKINFESESNSYWVNLNNAELELIGALLSRVRLGYDSIYKTAANEIMQGMDEALSDNFLMDSSDKVGIYFTLEDADGNIAATIKSDYSTIEVSDVQQP
jgi:hypothetical protein